MNSVKKLRLFFSKENIGGYLVPKNDFFFNEFVESCNDRLKFISNFTGSAGTALILKEKSYLFIDGRYTIQAKLESGNNYKIIDVGKTSILEFLEENYKNVKIGYDPNLFTFNAIKNILKKNKNFINIEKNLIDKIWKNKKKEACHKAFYLDDQYSGQNYNHKIEYLKEKLNINDRESFFISSNENLCWLLNIRGADSKFSPLLNAFALIFKSKTIVFTNLNKIPERIKKNYNKNVLFFSINLLKSYLSKNKKITIQIDPSITSFGLIKFLKRENIPYKFIKDPIFYLKCKKNKTEIQNLQIAHIFDGVALVKFLYWIAQSKFKNKLNEISSQNQLEKFRRKNPFYLGPSFPSISSFNKNSAIIHYNATPKTNLPLRKGTYLLDTGGQYKFGTTDVTRTLSIGTQNIYKKNIYTRVLKGHLAVKNFELTKISTGGEIDLAARKFLKEIRLDYPHSTGHGVGYYLNVHETPPSISKKSKNKFYEGQVVSNEPGFYQPGKFGIRIENLIYVKKYKNVLKFEDLTLVPYDKNLINKKLLNKTEIKNLNNYHKQVYEKLNAFLSKEELIFLKKLCLPI
jgi:Xaa-Pro aminopeptidase